MRFIQLTKGDIRFQYKYGFYFLYLIFSLLYISVAYVLPRDWRQTAVLAMVFTDPAALGLFFMGAIILYEKSERVLDALAVSPVKVSEYVASKLFSIGLISSLAALLIAVSSCLSFQPFYFISAVFMGSCLFSSFGLMLAAKSSTLNEFILSTIPFQIAINLPALAYLFGWQPVWLLIHPGASMIELMVAGRYRWPAFAVLLVSSGLACYLAYKVIRKMFSTLGGAKL